MPQHDVHIEREPWGFDQSFHRCEALDESDNHLSKVWFEKTGHVLSQPSFRRQWLAGLVLLPVSALATLLRRK